MPYPSMRRSLWKRPNVWLCLVAFTFLLNLWVAVVTIQGHQSGDSDTSTFMRGFVPAPTTTFQPTITEREYWNRMLDGRRPNETTTPLSCCGTTSSTSNTSTFFSDIQDYIDLNPETPSACHPPPRENDTAERCRIQQTATRYSVIVYSQADANDTSSGGTIRKIVIKLMALIAYPSVQDILLILKGDNNQTLLQVDKPSYPTKHQRSTKKYVQRLRQWQKNGVVSILPSSNVWDAMAHLKQPETDAVLWINGDLSKDWNGTQFKGNCRHGDKLHTC